MTPMIRMICATGALLSLTALATMAYADGRDFNDGPVQTVSFIRTVDGHIMVFSFDLLITRLGFENQVSNDRLIGSMDTDPLRDNCVPYIRLVRMHVH